MPATTCKLPMDFERLREQLRKVVQLKRDHPEVTRPRVQPTAAESSARECSRSEPSAPECSRCCAAVSELTVEAETLRAKLQQKAALGAELEDQLVRVLEKNTKLTIQNTDLQAQVHHLQHVSADSRGGGLASSNSPAADNLESILKQMREASEKRKELERLHAEALAQLRDTQIANANAASAASAAAAAAANASNVAAGGDKAKSFETIDALQSKIRELEKKTELQNVRHEELMLEMASIKRSTQAKPSPAWKNRNQDVSPESDMSTPEPTGRPNASMDAMLDQHTMGGAGRNRAAQAQQGCVVALPPSYPYLPLGLTNLTYLDACALGLIDASTAAYCMPPLVPPPPLPSSTSFYPKSGSLWKSPSMVDLSCNGYLALTQQPQPPNCLPVASRASSTASSGNTDAYGASASVSASASTQRPTTPTQQAPSSSSEIDRIMAKIEQDNRILAELDKTRSTIDREDLVASPPSSSGSGRQLPNCHPAERVEQHREAWTNYYLAVPQINFGGRRAGTASSNHRMAVASQGSSMDHQSALPASQHTEPMSSFLHQPSQHHHQHHQQSTGLSMLSQQTQQQANMAQHLPSHMQQSQLPSYGKPSSAYLLSGPSALTSTGHYGLGQQPPRLMPQIPVGVPPPPIPTILTTQYDVERLYSAFPGAEHLLGPDNKVVDMLDIPGKGRCYVYIARYSYDPFQQSPNDNPEAELPVHAGDYLLVWGNMDEDGFYDGELLDGRRGLVPSNFIQKLVGEDLLEFHQAAVLGLRDCDDSVSTNVAHEFDFHTPGDMSFLMEDTYGKHCMPDYTYMDLEDILEEEDDALNEQLGEGPVPPPKQLTLERQLNKSVLIGWNAPECGNPIDSYHVYVDGVLKTTVKASERTRALVEGVDSNRPHRISVRSITPNRRTSRDAACTMVIGKQVPLGPSHVKAAHVSSTSAVISWLPSNSNHQHAVCVNNVEVRTVKPGVYRHTITGLAPNTVYRVTVRAKNIRAPQFDEKQAQQIERFSCHIDFRTLPKGKGLPDPPVDIMVEAGPQDGTLLVTWLPVAMNASTSGAPVTGYAVYADGKKVTDVDSPTGDHALIDINKLLGLNPKQVTVRTKSRDSQSSDSVPTPIPSSALKGKGAKEAADKRRYGNAMPAHMRTGTRRDAHGQVVIDTDENLSDKEIYPPNHMSIPAIEITKDSASEGNYFSEDDYVDGRGARGGGGGIGGPGRQPGFVPRSHAERGRPPTLPHERQGGGRLDHQHQQQQRRDRAMEERDQYYMDGGRGDPRRGPHPGDRGYRGPPPGRGGPQHMAGGPPRGGPADKRMRWFVALFDYDPTTMSPNPDACEEELPFSEGDPIKIYGEKDADGFYWGECRGRRGFVPHNMVVEVQDMPKNMDTGGRGAHGRDRDRWGDIYASMPVKKMIALYDYDPQELSPNVDAEQVELTFSTGNVIYVYGEMDDDGFFMGELDGTRGLVPSNFLTEAPPDYAGGGVRRGPPPPRGMGGGGHGPGARGPPPPPRDPRMDPRDRRKDACLPTQIDYRAGDPYHHQGPGPAGRGRGEARGALRGGRGGGPPPPGGWGPRGPPPSDGYRQHPNQDHHPQDDLGYGPDPSTAPSNPAALRQPSARLLKGVPAVVPDFVIPHAGEAPPASALPKFPEAPNLMQKLSEMTGGADTSVDNLLSKGKELIFMKFGLGK